MTGILDVFPVGDVSSGELLVCALAAALFTAAAFTGYYLAAALFERRRK